MMTSRTYKLSFCIVCMNRLYQLRETLLKNIQDNAGYDELEFVLLNYNSQDGMAEWVKDNLGEYLANGRVVYYHTTEPQSFSHSHAKNLALKLAGGDIVCSVNADHYTGAGFAGYVNAQYRRNNNIVLTTIDFHRTKKDYRPAKDVLGRVCARKSDFLKIKGFDERMNRYGFEDYDFINRLELAGVQRVLIEDFSYLQYIAHTEEERFSMKGILNNLHGLYVRYDTPSRSELIILYKDSRFEKGILTDNSSRDAHNPVYAYRERGNRYQFSIEGPGFTTGQWQEAGHGNSIRFHPAAAQDFCLRKSNSNNNDLLYEENSTGNYYVITESASIKSIMRFNYFFHNRSVMEKNLEHKKIVVNEQGFGKATVYKNFQSQTPLIV